MLLCLSVSLYLSVQMLGDLERANLDLEHELRRLREQGGFAGSRHAVDEAKLEPVHPYDEVTSTSSPQADSAPPTLAAVSVPGQQQDGVAEVGKKEVEGAQSETAIAIESAVMDDLGNIYDGDTKVISTHEEDSWILVDKEVVHVAYMHQNMHCMHVSTHSCACMHKHIDTHPDLNA